MTATNITFSGTQYVLNSDLDMHNALSAIGKLGCWGSVSLHPDGTWTLHVSQTQADGNTKTLTASIGNTVAVVPASGYPVIWKE